MDIAGRAGALRASGPLSILLAEEGLASHDYVAHLSSAAASNAMLADAVHFLCLLHGRYPGVIDNAADRLSDGAVRGWIHRATAAFAAERAFLTRLVVAVGPVPSTAGQTQSEATVLSQAHALAVLSQSERRGTALGAAIALTNDWRPIRTILDRAASRAGLKPPPCDLPPPAETVALVERLEPALERAILFGARQLAAQHRGLFDLLETRATVRGSTC